MSYYLCHYIKEVDISCAWSGHGIGEKGMQFLIGYLKVIGKPRNRLGIILNLTLSKWV